MESQDVFQAKRFFFLIAIQYPESMLAAMFDPESERPPARKDDQGNFFLDGEPEPFKFILQFLRRGRLVNYLLTEMGRTISSFLSLLWSPHFQSRPGKPRGSPLQCGGRASRALREGDRHHRTAAHRRAGQGDHREEHTGKENFLAVDGIQMQTWHDMQYRAEAVPGNDV